MKKRSDTFLIFSFILFFSISISLTGKDYAVFFVVTDFDHWDDFPKSTEQQVRKIEKELIENYGFQTEFISNPTKIQILKKLAEYTYLDFNENDQLLIYFSMHGEYKNGQTGVLIPKNGKKNDIIYETWIQHHTLANVINAIPCEHILLSLDACYSGTFSGVRGKPTKPAFNREEDCKTKIRIALKNKSRYYLTSGGKERTPINSPFADKWYEALRYGHDDGFLSFSMLYAIVEQVKPKPKFGEFKDHHEEGDFLFVHQNACTSTPKLTDQKHWDKILSISSQNEIMQHIRMFPNCVHGTEITEIFATQKKSDEPLNFPKPSNSSTTASIASNMILVQGGTFIMGSEKGEEDEEPVHKVTVSSFYMNKYEVSQAEWESIMGKKPKNLEFKGCDQCPVEGVSWEDVRLFIKKLNQQTGLNYRLPTEAEWEYAAKGGNDHQPSGDVNDYAWYSSNSNNRTHPVGQKKPNNLGLYDMQGNVYEWCHDWYGKYYDSHLNNPIGSTYSNARVCRGGSWGDGANFITATNRGKRNPKSYQKYIGFRLARVTK